MMPDYETETTKSYILDEKGSPVQIDAPPSMYFYGHGKAGLPTTERPTPTNCRNCGAPNSPEPFRRASEFVVGEMIGRRYCEYCGTTIV